MSADFGVASIKMAGSLIFISCLIICLFFLIKRIRWNSMAGDKNVQMRLLSMLHLAPKRAIALIEIRGQWLIIGIGTESVTFLSKMDPPSEPCESEIEIPEDRKRFHSVLRDVSFWPKGLKTRIDEKIK